MKQRSAIKNDLFSHQHHCQKMDSLGDPLSVNIDKRYKIIRKFVADTARTHDRQHVDGVRDGSNTNRDVFATIEQMGDKVIRVIGQTRTRCALAMGRRNRGKFGCRQHIATAVIENLR